MKFKFVSTGHGTFVHVDSVIALSPPDSSPIKKLRKYAEEKGILINLTSGRKARSVLVMNTGQVILSSLQTETMVSRLNGNTIQIDKERVSEFSE
jgi:regulator of extracellular matrix RemA (YlzA/DUF370 family)